MPVVLLHELFGVDRDLIDLAEELAQRGHPVSLPELYHRVAPAGTAYPRDDAGRAKGFARLGELTRDDAVTSVVAALALAGSKDDARDAPVVLVGLSVGATIAFLTATRHAVLVTVCLYPGWLTSTDVPFGPGEPIVTAVTGIQGRIEIAVGDRDHVICLDEVDTLSSALASAGVDHQVEVLRDVGHAFMWPQSPTYDAAARRSETARILAAVGRAANNADGSMT